MEKKISVRRLNNKRQAEFFGHLKQGSFLHTFTICIIYLYIYVCV